MTSDTALDLASHPVTHSLIDYLTALTARVTKLEDNARAMREVVRMLRHRADENTEMLGELKVVSGKTQRVLRLEDLDDDE